MFKVAFQVSQVEAELLQRALNGLDVTACLGLMIEVVQFALELLLHVDLLLDLTLLLMQSLQLFLELEQFLGCLLSHLVLL